MFATGLPSEMLVGLPKLKNVWGLIDGLPQCCCGGF